MKQPMVLSKILSFSVISMSLFLFDSYDLSSTAQARAGGGRSSGRSSSFGGRRAAPPAYQRSAPQQQAPAAPRSPAAGPAAQNQPAPQAPASGGFMRNMAGGIAGGFLGSMLFNSIGHGAGMGGAGGLNGGGGGGSGFGLFEMLLLGGIMYFAFRWWKARQPAVMGPAFDGTASYSSAAIHSAGPIVDVPQPLIPASMNLESALDPETAGDIFFRIQGAWTRRDLTSVASLIDADLLTTMNVDLTHLKDERQINRLENISVRKIELRDAWTELGAELATMRVLANMLDYNVDETTSQIVEGSDTVPVKFEEDWTFRRENGETNWKLAGISQI